MITVKNLSYQYTPEKVLHFPDFHLEKGNHCLLLGESGSGKTTLLHLLGGLLRIKQGSIVIGSTNMASLSESEADHFRGKYVGFIFQRNHLITSLTVKRNLLLSPYLAGLKPDINRAEKILLQLGIAEILNARITQLSQGQLQRVAIARALLNNPSVIFADEPTSALDDKNCDRVIRLLMKAADENGATLVVATHDQRLKDQVPHQIVLTQKNSLVR
jgi:ABC-type lipoprotein export system ATPase subunit